MAARIEATKDMNINLNIHVIQDPPPERLPERPPIALEASDPDSTLAKVTKVAGEILYILGLVITAGVIVGLACHVTGLIAVSALTLALCFAIGQNLTAWGYNMRNGKLGKDFKPAIVTLETKVDLGAIAAKTDGVK